MTQTADLRDALNATINARGEDLCALAKIVHSRLPFLEHLVRRRNTIRTDKRLPPLGIGVDIDANMKLHNNLNLIAHLLKDALDKGYQGEDAFFLLADVLYEMKHYMAAADVLREAMDRNFRSARIQRTLSKTLLAIGDAASMREFQTMQETSGEAVSRMEVIDFKEFPRWTQVVGAATRTIVDEPCSMDGLLRVMMDGETHEFKDTRSAEPLHVAVKRDLKIFAGCVPFAHGSGFYYTDGILSLRESPLTVDIAHSSFAFRHRDAKRISFPGKHIVPCCSVRYFSQYSHGIIQIYSRLITAMKTGLFDDHGILLPATTPDWAMEFLSYAGLDKGKIQIMPLYAISEVEEAVVLPMKWDICPLEMQTMRKALSAAFPYPEERVNYYLLRKGVKNFHRALVNEDAFVEICESHGFQVVDPLDFSLREQMDLFRKAGTIVTSCSSADTNMIYAPPGAHIVVVVPRVFIGMLSADVATGCGHTMTAVVGKYMEGDRNVTASDSPYVADPALLASLLEWHL